MNLIKLCFINIYVEKNWIILIIFSQNFLDCSCASPKNVTDNGKPTTVREVLKGKCDQKCKNLYAYAFFIVVLVMSTLVSVTPKNMITLRYIWNIHVFTIDNYNYSRNRDRLWKKNLLNRFATGFYLALRPNMLVEWIVT